MDEGLRDFQIGISRFSNEGRENGVEDFDRRRDGVLFFGESTIQDPHLIVLLALSVLGRDAIDGRVTISDVRHVLLECLKGHIRNAWADFIFIAATYFYAFA